MDSGKFTCRQTNTRNLQSMHLMHNNVLKPAWMCDAWGGNLRTPGFAISAVAVAGLHRANGSSRSCFPVLSVRVLGGCIYLPGHVLFLVGFVIWSVIVFPANMFADIYQAEFADLLAVFGLRMRHCDM